MVAMATLMDRPGRPRCEMDGCAALGDWDAWDPATGKPIHVCHAHAEELDEIGWGIRSPWQRAEEERTR